MAGGAQQRRVQKAINQRMARERVLTLLNAKGNIMKLHELKQKRNTIATECAP